METLYLGLGSNIGDRLSHIEAATAALGEIISGLLVAPVYETAPRDFEDQADFLNTVVSGECNLSPINILQFIHDVEQSGGRNRFASPVKGPRTIDIDILLIGEQILNLDTETKMNLTVPHQSMHQRLFVLRPLLDLKEDLKDPRDSIRWAMKASHLIDQQVKLYST